MENSEKTSVNKLPIPRLQRAAPNLTRKRQKSPETKLKKKRLKDRCKVYIGHEFERWRELRMLKHFKTDTALATFLLNSYFQTESAKNERDLAILERTPSPEATVEVTFTMSSSDEEQESSGTSATVSLTEQELEKEAAIYQSLTCPDEQTTTDTPKDKENKVQNEDDEELTPSLCVVDGRRQVDLGSSSEFIVDEQCILELLTSCRKCNHRCTVNKLVKGLKIVVFQECLSCENYFEWTNLPDDDGDKEDSDCQINGQNTGPSLSNDTS